MKTYHVDNEASCTGMAPRIVWREVGAGKQGSLLRTGAQVFRRHDMVSILGKRERENTKKEETSESERGGTRNRVREKESRKRSVRTYMLRLRLYNDQIILFHLKYARKHTKTDAHT